MFYFRNGPSNDRYTDLGRAVLAAMPNVPSRHVSEADAAGTRIGEISPLMPLPLLAEKALLHAQAKQHEKALLYAQAKRHEEALLYAQVKQQEEALLHAQVKQHEEALLDVYDTTTDGERVGLVKAILKLHRLLEGATVISADETTLLLTQLNQQYNLAPILASKLATPSADSASHAACVTNISYTVSLIA